MSHDNRSQQGTSVFSVPANSIKNEPNKLKRKRNEWYRKAQFFVEFDYKDWQDAFVNGVEYICEMAKEYYSC